MGNDEPGTQQGLRGEPHDGADARTQLAEWLGLEPGRLSELPQQSIEVLLGLVEAARTDQGLRRPLRDLEASGTRSDAFATAHHRDLDADLRDLAAQERDVAAELRDLAAGDLDRLAGNRADSDRQYATDERARGASGGAEAAENRAQAINDRKLAADDRVEAEKDREGQARGASGTELDTFASAGEGHIAGRDRDLAAQGRDVAAELRDLRAGLRAASDRQHAADEGARAASGGTGAAENRNRAINDRRIAADDRSLDSHDRKAAAYDRAQAARDREDSGIDELTGALRRGTGLAAIEREIDRARRLQVELVAAYVDVDGLKAENDTRGHAAGDTLLVAVAGALRASLRTYDVITRVGGDEFLCVLSGITVEYARLRFEAASAKLAANPSGASFTVGFAQLRADESGNDLVYRADADLLKARSRR